MGGTWCMHESNKNFLQNIVWETSREGTEHISYWSLPILLVY